MKKRIYEIAKITNVTSKEIIQFLQKKGFANIKVSQNSVGDEEIQLVEKHFKIKITDDDTRAGKKATQKKAAPQKVIQKKKSDPLKKQKVEKSPKKDVKAVDKPSPVKTTKKVKEPVKPAPAAIVEEPVEPKKTVDLAPDGKEKKIYALKPDFNRERTRRKRRVISKRRQRRDAHEQARAAEKLQLEEALKKVKLPEAMTVKELAEVTKIAVTDIIKKLFMLGVVATINQRIERSTLQMICDEYGFEVEFVDDTTSYNLSGKEYTSENILPRPPIVTILGHVDHGKTTLLDYIRRTKVVEKESGGITQHIGAYTVELEGKGQITFLDTPGHEAFTAMRAHGANVTDIVILVVAADDGVMPQTLESIAHSQAAGVPVIVAINKMDRPNANPDKIKQVLSGHNLAPEEWGGSTIYVEISALKGDNIDSLLEMIVLQAELAELKAPVDCFAKGVIIESKLQRGRGVVATVLIQSGKLMVSDNIIAGMTSGRVKVIYNQFGKKINAVNPAVAAEILGLDDVPESGDRLYAVETTKFARQVSQLRQIKVREQRMSRESRVNLDNLYAKMAGQEVKTLNIVLKADTQGSLLALKDSFEKLTDEEVIVKIIHNAVGGIRKSDVMLAAASDAIIIGFHVRPDKKASELAAIENVGIECYKVIYEAIDTVKSALVGMYAPEFKEEIVGTALVKETFNIPKAGTIAGCYIDSGKICKNDNLRIVRDGVEVFEGGISSLRRFKDTVKEVKKGFECGVLIDGFGDVKPGDIFEVFKRVQIERSI
ncbi:translation initiation factor IF-2 [Candidatus Riflebacteria bacterium]